MAIDGSATAIEVTPQAVTKLLELRADDPKRAFLRVYVAGRSCCSFMYGLAFDETPAETDAVTDSVHVVELVLRTLQRLAAEVAIVGRDLRFDEAEPR